MNTELKQDKLTLEALKQVSGGSGIGSIFSIRSGSGGIGSGSGGGSSSSKQHFAALSARLSEGAHQPGAKYQL